MSADIDYLIIIWVTWNVGFTFKIVKFLFQIFIIIASNKKKSNNVRVTSEIVTDFFISQRWLIWVFPLQLRWLIYEYVARLLMSLEVLSELIESISNAFGLSMLYVIVLVDINYNLFVFSSEFYSLHDRHKKLILIHIII